MEALAPLTAPELKSKIPAVVPQIGGIIGGQVPISMDLVNIQILEESGKTITVLVFDVRFRDRWVLSQVQVQSTPNGEFINGFHVTPTPGPAASLNPFSLADKSWRHWLMLMLGAASLATTLSALALLVRSRGLPRRWLWGLGIIVGFGQLSLNWTSGEASFSLLALQAFGVGASKVPIYAPWVVQVSVPVVAVIFLIRRDALLARAQAATMGS
ncbi:hypothetical protein HHL28_09565 [Aerophototrophica crusticola]|uniref:Uncharacterized protein n=1 Tax=Aerophototrophica crusticola TaxID=1709002 RepID=A0A858R7F8_9PROT|nr:hypothetical protein HHL28_09565 [Rhodospirillaceae bacterium B3]